MASFVDDITFIGLSKMLNDDGTLKYKNPESIKVCSRNIKNIYIKMGYEEFDITILINQIDDVIKNIENDPEFKYKGRYYYAIVRVLEANNYQGSEEYKKYLELAILKKQESN